MGKILFRYNLQDIRSSQAYSFITTAINQGFLQELRVVNNNKNYSIRM